MHTRSFLRQSTHRAKLKSIQKGFVGFCLKFIATLLIYANKTSKFAKKILPNYLILQFSAILTVLFCIFCNSKLHKIGISQFLNCIKYYCNKRKYCGSSGELPRFIEPISHHTRTYNILCILSRDFDTPNSNRLSQYVGNRSQMVLFYLTSDIICSKTFAYVKKKQYLCALFDPIR